MALKSVFGVGGVALRVGERDEEGLRARLDEKQRPARDLRAPGSGPRGRAERDRRFHRALYAPVSGHAGAWRSRNASAARASRSLGSSSRIVSPRAVSASAGFVRADDIARPVRQGRLRRVRNRFNHGNFLPAVVRRNMRRLAYAPGRLRPALNDDGNSLRRFYPALTAFLPACKPRLARRSFYDIGAELALRTRRRRCGPDASCGINSGINGILCLLRADWLRPQNRRTIRALLTPKMHN